MGKVPELVVVLLCILGGGAFVTVLAAFGKSLWSRAEEPENNFNQRSPEQDSYLRRVREINQVAIWGQARAQRKEARRQRERDASDIEIQSSGTYSNVEGPAGYAQHGSAYHGQRQGPGHGRGHAHSPVVYYEEDYGHEHQDAGYAEQQYPQQTYQQPYQQQQQQQQPQSSYTGGQGVLYANSQSKAGPVEMWSEVPPR